MRTVVRAFPILLLAAIPALADLPSVRHSRAHVQTDAAPVKAATGDSFWDPEASTGPGKGACDLVADPANLTHWLAYKQLDQWVPCEPGQAVDVRFLVSSVADATQAHFCAPQMPVARQMNSASELGRLRCTYAGQDLAAGRKSANWEVKPLPAAVPYRLASLSEPIVGPARPASSASAAAEATDKPGPPAKPGRSAKPSKPARAASAARP